MTSFDKITGYINRFVSLNASEAEEFAAGFTEAKIKKRQFIVQPGFTAKNRNYIITGAFRAYLVTDDGQEHTIQLAVDDWWISDYNSYISQQPATLFVVALENSTILQLPYEKEKELKRSNHKFETFFRIIAEKGLAFEHRRIITNLTQTAEERYETCLENYPQIAARVPQYALASYLGMTTEFLSRIRNKRMPKKN
jgi:CRP-like cAMP-binding protein